MTLGSRRLDLTLYWNTTNNTTTGASAPLLSSPVSVDFARFNGLQTLLDINSVPVGSYNEVVVTLGSAQIGYLSVTSGNPPALQTMAATLSSATVTKTLKNPLVVNTAEPVGVRMDWTISEFGQRIGKVRERKAQVAQAVENLHATQNKVRMDVESEQRKINRSETGLEAARESVTARGHVNKWTLSAFGPRNQSRRS